MNYGDIPRGLYVIRGENVVLLGEIDLLNEATTQLLADNYLELEQAYAAAGAVLPQNRGSGMKMRELDCLVINDCMGRLRSRGIEYDTVRGAFLEGDPAYPGAGFSREGHLQIAVRNLTCILGIFRPNM